eukprot:283449-Pyramimonas_sp.AAC.1
MGEWDLAKALVLDWNPGNIWTGTVPMSTTAPLEYKFLIAYQDGSVCWQPGFNHKLAAAAQEVGVQRHVIHQ